MLLGLLMPVVLVGQAGSKQSSEKGGGPAVLVLRSESLVARNKPDLKALDAEVRTWFEKAR